MENPRANEFVIIAEGFYETLEEAKHALLDPFVEDFVEKTGKFKIHNFKDIFACSGVTLEDLSIDQLEDEVFEISTRDSAQILTRRRADQLAETLRRQGMFDEITVEPLENNDQA